MTKITFGRAIARDSEVIVKGDTNLLSRKSKVRMYIEDAIPVAMSRLTKALIAELGHLGYIEFMSKAEIYREA